MSRQELKDKLSVLALSAKNDNTLYGDKILFTGVYAYTCSNGSFSRVPFITHFNGMLSYSAFSSFVNQATKDIEFIVDDVSVTLKQGKAKLKLVLEPYTDFTHQIELPENVEWKPINIVDSIRELSCFCNPKNDNYVLRFIYFNNNNILVSNGATLIKRKTDNIGNFLIHSNHIRNIEKLKPEQFYEGNGYLHFCNEVGRYICPKENQTYVQTDSFFTKEEHNIAFSEEAKEVLKNAENFTDKLGNIKFNIKDGIMTVYMDVTDSLSYSDSFEVNSDLTIENKSINIKMLQRCVNDFGTAALSGNLLKFSNGTDFIVCLVN